MQKATSSSHILETANDGQYASILSSSFTKDVLDSAYVSPASNGFVDAAIAAYNQHHHLTIRPDDVWFAILTQLNFYINAHVEELRDVFVSHEGKKTLEVKMHGTAGTAGTVDFGAFALAMADLLAVNVKDPALRDWVMPDFSTTTDEDRAVGGVLFMGAMQGYFRYLGGICCGLPSATLLGEVADYRRILARLDMFDRLGKEPTAVARLLRPVLAHMIMSFEEGATPRVVSFWNTIAHKHDLSSGSPRLSGWITAFCVWDAKGRSCLNPYGETEEDGADDGEGEGWNGRRWQLQGKAYPEINADRVPSGSASVPILIDDNGEAINCTMVAGSAAVRATAPTADQLAAVSSQQRTGEEKTAVQPVPG